MKIISRIRLVTVGVLLLAFGGCKEITVTTLIHPDGSCRRTILVGEDSTDVKELRQYPISEEIPWEGMHTDEGYVLRHDFKSVEDLNRSFARDSDSLIQIDVELRRRFRWFYTFLEYRETYHATFPFTHIPLSEHFTEDEIAFIASTFDSTGAASRDEEGSAEEEHAAGSADEEVMEKRFFEWIRRNAFEEFYADLLQIFREAMLPGITEQVLESKKEEIYESLIVEDEDFFELAGAAEVIGNLDRILGSGSVLEWEDRIAQSIGRIEGKLEHWIFPGVSPDEFHNVLIMPGLIVDTNAGSIEGNRVTWDFGGDRFSVLDYTMWVESRVVNMWAMGLTGGIVFVLIVLLLLGTIRSRRSGGPP